MDKEERSGRARGWRARWRRETRLPTTHSSIRGIAAADWTRIKLVLGFTEPNCAGKRRQPPIAHVRGVQGTRSADFCVVSARAACASALCPRERTGPPRYAAFVPLNQHVLAPVAGNRIFCIRVFPRPIFRPLPRVKTFDLGRRLLAVLRSFLDFTEIS